MNKVLAIIGGAIAAVVFFFIGAQIGQWYIGVLKGTEGMVTASDIIGLRYVLPLVVAGIAGYCAYSLIKDK